MEFTCNMCCEIREKYVVERPRDGGKDCPYKVRPFSEGEAPPRGQTRFFSILYTLDK